MGPHRQRRDRLGDKRHRFRHLRRHRDPDRIGQRHLARLRVRRALRHFHHAIDRHFALERAAEGGGDRDLRGAAGGPRQRHRLARDRKRFGGGLPLIANTERVAGDAHRAELVDAARQRALGAAAVEHQRDIGHVVAARQPGDHRLGIGHLRHARGIDEARHLQPPRARTDRAVDQFELGRGRNDAVLILQPVAGGDLDDFDCRQDLLPSKNIVS